MVELVDGMKFEFYHKSSQNDLYEALVVNQQVQVTWTDAYGQKQSTSYCTSAAKRFIEAGYWTVTKAVAAEKHTCKRKEHIDSRHPRTADIFGVDYVSKEAYNDLLARFENLERKHAKLQRRNKALGERLKEFGLQRKSARHIPKKSLKIGDKVMLNSKGYWKGGAKVGAVGIIDEIKYDFYHVKFEKEDLIDHDWDTFYYENQLDLIKDQKEIALKPGMKCRIKSCSNGYYVGTKLWYNNNIGEIVTLEQRCEGSYSEFEDYYYWKVKGYTVGIMENDLEPIEETQAVGNVFESMETKVTQKRVTFPSEYCEDKYKVEGCIILTNTVPSQIVAELATPDKAEKLCQYMNKSDN